MQECSRLRGLFTEGVYMRHDIVAEASLVGGRGVKINVVEMGSHGGKRSLGNVQSELALRLSKRKPHAPPLPDTMRLPPEPLHRGRGVAGFQR